MMISESGLVLSIPQLRLGINLLDDVQWDDLPLIATEEPLEQRMMNAFFGMVQAGWMRAVLEGYELDPGFRDLMLRIGQAEERFCVCDDRRILALLYKRADAVAAVTPDLGNPDHCKIRLYDPATLEVAADAVAEGREGVTVQKWNGASMGPGQYDMEQLGLFFGTRMEEAE